MSRRRALGTLGISASVMAAAGLLGGEGVAQAAPETPGLSVTLLGTAGGPPPLAVLYDISSALTVDHPTPR